MPVCLDLERKKYDYNPLEGDRDYNIITIVTDCFLRHSKILVMNYGISHQTIKLNFFLTLFAINKSVNNKKDEKQIWLYIPHTQKPICAVIKNPKGYHETKS